MHRKILPALVLLALVLCTGKARAQVAARQGVAPAPEIVNFESPMILDLPLPNLARVEAGLQVQLPKVRKYICDKDVTLLNLAIAKKLVSRRNKESLLLTVTGSVFVAESYDRRADIGLRLKSGDQVLTSEILRNLAAEEKRSTPFAVTLPITEAALRDALASQVAPTLELTLTVRDDS